MILSGRLADWSLHDLLQILQITEKTATLEIDGEDRRGTLYFRNGRIVDADATGPAGSARERIIETIYSLELLVDGAFAVGTHDRDADTSIEVPEALEGAHRHLQAENDLAASRLLEAGSLALGGDHGSPVSLEAETWAAFQTLVGSFTFQDLVDRLGRLKAVAFVNALHSQTLIRGNEGEAEGWVTARSVPPPAESHPSDDVAPEAELAVDQQPESDSEPEPQPEPVSQSEPEPQSEPVSPSDPEPQSEPDEPAVPAFDDAPVLAEAQPIEAAGVVPVERLTVVRLDELEVGDLPIAQVDEASARRREMKAVISPVDTTLVPGVLGDLRQRFRPVDERHLP